MADIKREIMPQLSVNDIKEFRKHLLDHNITSKLEMINVGLLKPTQTEFNKDKVKNIYNQPDNVNDNPIIISNDNRILDGHHRWLARAKKDKHGKILVLRCNASIDKLFKIAHDFPEVEVKNINELKNYL